MPVLHLVVNLYATYKIKTIGAVASYRDCFPCEQSKYCEYWVSHPECEAATIYNVSQLYTLWIHIAYYESFK